MKTDTGELYRNYIGGAWVEASDGDTIENRNPADTGDFISRHATASSHDAEAAVNAAAAAFPAWRNMAIGKRAGILEKAAAYLEANADQFGEELSREEGKLRALGVGEVKRAAQTLRFYAIEGQTLTGETYPQDDAEMLVYSVREPLGVVSVITPWNFPISIPARKIAPALITGNTVVFKPSSEAPLIAYRLVEAFAKAGLPDGVLNLLIGTAQATGPAITTDPRVRAVSFTGSTAAGEFIHRSLPITTRSQMELGGKNPLIVLADADLDKATQLAVAGGFSLTGQACTGTSRVIVHRDVKEAFIDKLAGAASALSVGNGLEEGVKVGPLASAAQLKTVMAYIEVGKNEGRLVAGGSQLTGGAYDLGYFVEPTVFADVSRTARIAQEEIFGPVICVLEAADYDEAIDIANDVQYGLSASLVTNDFRYIQRFAQDIESGTVKVNRTTTGNLVNAPFGGIKMSSTATFRESGRAGLEFFTQIKTVYLGR